MLHILRPFAHPLRAVIAVFLSIILFSLFFGSCSSEPFDPVREGKLLLGTTVNVTLYEEGETRIRDIYALSAPVPGYLLRIELDPGDRVQVTYTEAVAVTVEETGG